MSSDVPAYKPQLATLVDEPPSGAEIASEFKLDGYRIGCTLSAGKVRLESRNANDWTAQFPQVVEAAKAIRAKTALLDGEVAALLPSGLTSFQTLHDAHAIIVYFVFDLIHLDGENIAALPFQTRKDRLRTLLEASEVSPVIRYTDHVIGDAARVFAEACKLGAEGIVCKSVHAAYRPGRNSSWVKVKCVQRQELVVGGFTEPEGSRAGIGALLVGYYDAQGALVFAGKVGTGKGFTREFLVGLRTQLDPIVQTDCPFSPRPKSTKVSTTRWVTPKLVVEVQFMEWTGDGHLRHPSLIGLRKDKHATDVVRERPSS